MSDSIVPRLHQRAHQQQDIRFVTLPAGWQRVLGRKHGARHDMAVLRQKGGVDFELTNKTLHVLLSVLRL